MPRLPAKQREAEKVATRLSDGSYAAAVNDSPARFSWDEHTKRLLGKLQGDRRKRKNTIENFIQQLVRKREEFRREKKTGAGSTTEAIEFYQYVLEKNNLWKAKAGKKPKSKDAAVGSGGFSNHSEETEGTTTSAEEEEFLNQHNDFCEVCAMGGELICCSTCNLVFHLNCCRPVLKSMPPDTWSCAHCDATGVTNYKKESRQRKRALAAVREMERLQTEFREKKKGGNLVNPGEVGVAEGTSADAGVAEGDADGKIKAENEGMEGDDDKKPKAEPEAPADPNAICKVCSFGGELFGCSQDVCDNKFHLACIRPIMEEKPANDWSCPYCDVNFVTGLKPQARRRRASISGVRFMDKMKAEYDTKRKEGILPPPSHVQQDLSSKKRKLEDMEGGSPVHPGQPRQRSKSQGSMNMDGAQEDNKQADSLKTDDNSVTATVPLFHLPQAPRYTKADVPPEVYKKFGPKTMNTNSRHGQYNCKYCMDSEKSETCCFCACRICFIKDDKPNTILCDLCDGEYHIYCLVPPMEKIPSTDWFCPTCTAAITKAKSNASAKVESTKPEKKKGKPGRPKGSGKSSSKTATKKSTHSKSSKKALREKKSFFSSHQPRTASGRFAPKPKNAPTAEELAAAMAAAPVVKRGPGRPPKSQTKAAMAARALAQSRKLAAAAAAAGGGVGGKEKPMFGANGMLASMTQQRSRSGRVVKRNTAYDEVEERTKKPAASSAGNVKKESSTSIPSTGSTQTRGTPAKPSAAAILAAKTAASTLGSQPDTSKISQDKVQSSPMVSPQDYPSSSSVVDSSQLNNLIHPLSSKPNSDKQLSVSSPPPTSKSASSSKNPRRKPGARECMQISRRFGASVISQNYMDILMDYCSRGKVEHLIRMRERLDEHSRFLESQLAGLEVMVKEKEKMKAISKTLTTSKGTSAGNGDSGATVSTTPSKAPLVAAPLASIPAQHPASASKPVPILSPEVTAASSSSVPTEPAAPLPTPKATPESTQSSAQTKVAVSAAKPEAPLPIPAKTPVATITPASESISIATPAGKGVPPTTPASVPAPSMPAPITTIQTVKAQEPAPATAAPASIPPPTSTTVPKATVPADKNTLTASASPASQTIANVDTDPTADAKVATTEAATPVVSKAPEASVIIQKGNAVVSIVSKESPSK